MWSCCRRRRRGARASNCRPSDRPLPSSRRLLGERVLEEGARLGEKVVGEKVVGAREEERLRRESLGEDEKFGEHLGREVEEENVEE